MQIHYKSKILFTIIAVMFFTFIVDKKSPNQTIMVSQMHKAQQTIELLKRSIRQQNKKHQHAYFEQLRRDFHEFSWILPHYFSIEIYEKLNNSKYWVMNQPIYQAKYPEAGVFQYLEKSLYQPSISSIDCLEKITLLEQQIRTLEKRFNTAPLQQSDIHFLAYICIQEQYLLWLTGYERIDNKQVIPEIQQSIIALNVYIQDVQYQQLSKRLNNYLAGKSFENINRFEVYQQYYRPLLQRLHQLQQRDNAPIPSYLVAQNTEQNDIFSENFLQVAYFSKQSFDSSVSNLGKMLFFDPILSANNKRACASCHKPQKAFSDGRQASIGFSISEKLTRNSPSLLNAIFSQYYSHDLAKNTLEDQLLFVVHNAKEFNTDLVSAVRKLEHIPQYQQLFMDGFPHKPAIDSTNILKALVVYLGTLHNFDSPFDQLMTNTLPNNTEPFIKGYNLFMGKAGCGSCHFAPVFSGLKPPFFQHSEYQSLSVPQHLSVGSPIDIDLGVGGNARKQFSTPKYRFFFKTPSLRNLKLTAPYMHNGIFIELPETINFHTPQSNYATHSSTIARTALTTAEKADLLVFIQSLNGKISPKFKEPSVLPTTTNPNDVFFQRKSGGIY